MEIPNVQKLQHLVVDTTAFIENAPLLDLADNIVTVQEVVNEITNKRQLRRLVVLPYDLKIKQVFAENIDVVTEFAKKTGDYPSLSATDIKVIALTYQLEKEYVGVAHLRKEPLDQKGINVDTKAPEINPTIAGFFSPGSNTKQDLQTSNEIIELKDDKFKELDQHVFLSDEDDDSSEWNSEDDSDDNSGWITPSNVREAKKQIDTELADKKFVKVACLTTDFAMQNVLRQINLNVSTLNGMIIKQLRTYILRCYTCFTTTSLMTKKFCPKCGNNTLKRVGVSLDENGKRQIHINGRRPLTARGKKFSLPTMHGGKHSNNPILVPDQPTPDQKPSRLARTKNNPMDDDYIAGYSPFVMRDINSKSAQLCIRSGSDVKHWMRRNPNETRRKQK